MKITDTREGQAWLEQFDPEDVGLATAMLEALVLVPSSEFRRWTAGEVLREQKVGRLALYGEREFPLGGRFFNQLAAGPVRRAVGTSGPELVKPRRGSPYVGSEGIVAQLLSELSKRRDAKLLLTPGPDRLRPQKSRGPTRRLAIVTDVIGSGDRILKMLDAMWRTESVRSWYSHRKVDLEFIVISYAATEAGLQRVRRHRLRPKVIVNIMVPTLHDRGSAEMMELCRKYDPREWSDEPGPLGYKEAGTLFAFAHGCPNTTPRVFWARGQRYKQWTPLFPDRSAAELDGILHKASVADFADRLVQLGRGSLSEPEVLGRFSAEAREALLLLAAIAHGLRRPERIATRTGLSIPMITKLLSAFSAAKWIDGRNAITESGLSELRAAERVAPPPADPSLDRVSVYFPTSLRG